MTKKNRIGLSVASACVVMGLRQVGAAVVAGPIVDPSTQHKYYVVAGTTWADDEAQAVGIGGHLVTINNATENAWIAANVIKNYSASGGPNLLNTGELYIGYYDPTGIAHDDGPGGPNSQHAKNFVWVDGEVSTYTNWDTNEPNDVGLSGVGGDTFEYYGIMYTPLFNGGSTFGKWNDVALHFQVTYGIVEVPEPAELALLVPAVGLLARRRR